MGCAFRAFINKGSIGIRLTACFGILFIRIDRCRFKRLFFFDAPGCFILFFGTTKDKQKHKSNNDSQDDNTF